jgi:hypothetical protein
VQTVEEMTDRASGEMITVSQIETRDYQQFQEAAFERYKQTVITYGQRVWREARSVAHQRDPDADVIEITTPDVEAATIRIEMKLARLRQLRFPFRIVQQLLTLGTGILAKVLFDLANLAQGSPGKDWLPYVLVSLLIFILGISAVGWFESRAELLR